MSVNVDVVMRFAGNAVTAGLAKAKAQVADFGRGLHGLKRAFAGVGSLGQLFGIGAVGKILSDVIDKSRQAMASMDFSEVSYKNAKAITFMADRFTDAKNTMVSWAAAASGAVIRFTSSLGAIAGGLFEAAVNPNVSWKEGLFGAGQASKIDNTTTSAEDLRRERDMERMLKHTASGLEIMARRRKEAAEAAKKEAEEQQKIADELSRSAEAAAVKAKNDAKTLAALAVGPMSDLRSLDEQKRQEKRDQREMDRLLRRADRKIERNKLGLSHSSLTRREELALASRKGVATGDVQRDILTYTKKTADTIEAALSLK